MQRRQELKEKTHPIYGQSQEKKNIRSQSMDPYTLLIGYIRQLETTDYICVWVPLEMS